MQVVLLNDTRGDQNPGCQATVFSLVRQLSAATRGDVTTRPRGDGYTHFAEIARDGRAHSPDAWHEAVSRLATDRPLIDALSKADLVVANLEGTFHHHTMGALALGGALAVAHRMGKRAWAVNGTVEAIDSWLLQSVLGPCEHVAVREPLSGRLLAGAGLRVAAAADCVFSLDGFFHREPSRDARSRAVLYTPGVLASIDDTRNTDAVLADLHALTALGWRPVFLQMADGEEPVATSVKAAGWPVESVRDIAWNAFGSYLRQFELVVSGRYHVLIFAAMAGVPAVALQSNTFKIAGLLELLGSVIPFAPDATALRDILTAPSLPPAIDRPVIRRCQAMASLNVPRIAGPRLAADHVVAIEGLDLVADIDLAATLVDLRRDGPDVLRTTIDTQPTCVTVDSALPVRPRHAWLALLGQAGFIVDAEDPHRSGRAVLRLRKSLLADEPSCARLDSLLGLSASRRESWDPSSENSSHVVFLVRDVGDLDRVRARVDWRPAHSFSVVVLRDAPVADRVRAWCRSRAITRHSVRTAEDLDWNAFPQDAALEGPTCALTVAARTHGWQTIDPTRGDGPIRVALFGASSAGLAAAARLRGTPGLRLDYFLDNSPELWQRSVDGLPVLAPDVAFALDNVDVIVVTSMHSAAIAQQIIDAGCGYKLLMKTTELEVVGAADLRAVGAADLRAVGAADLPPAREPSADRRSLGGGG